MLPSKFRIELTVQYDPDTKEVTCYYRLLDHKALNWLMKQLIRLLRKKISTDEFTITPNCIIFTIPFELEYNFPYTIHQIIITLRKESS